jgi:hypothetical protein
VSYLLLRSQDSHMELHIRSRRPLLRQSAEAPNRFHAKCCGIIPFSRQKPTSSAGTPNLAVLSGKPRAVRVEEGTARCGFHVECQ